MSKIIASGHSYHVVYGESSEDEWINIVRQHDGETVATLSDSPETDGFLADFITADRDTIDSLCDDLVDDDRGEGRGEE